MTKKNKSYSIELSFSPDFVEEMERIYNKYGEEVFSIQGIANKHMDINSFSKKFFGNSANVAEASVDGNANVKEKNVSQFTSEHGKSILRLNSLYMMYKTIKKMFNKEEASTALEKVINGELFINDLHSYAYQSYCYAFDLRNLLMYGMNFFKGNMVIHPPTRSDSFIDLLIQSTAYISNQIVGAAGYPDLFNVLNYFYEKEHGVDYISKLQEGRESFNPNSEIWYKVKNQFQNLIYSLNFPYRSGQSAFTNVSIMDRGFLKSLFEGYVYPDLSEPNFENIYELGKIFFEYFTDINSKEGIFTFPVTTLACSLDDNGNYLDEEFVKWTAKINSKKALGNVFIDLPTVLSSCCRYRSDITKVADAGYQNSFGVGGLSIGSTRVAGLNLPRIAMLEKDNPNILLEDAEICHKILLAHRKIIKDKIKAGTLPLYTSGWIDLHKQYSTIGFMGAYEYVKNKGMDITSKEGTKVLVDALKSIEDKIELWEVEEKSHKNIYNIEGIPGESVCVRLAECDYILGYNNIDGNKQYELYSNQYIPLISDDSIYDRMRVQGELDSITSGGAILHINVDDEKPLDENQYFKLIDNARKAKVKYFAVNYAYSECSDGHFSIGKQDICPVCSKKIVQQFTRTVGFITPVKAWIPTRRDYEFPKRKFYSNTEVVTN